MEGKNSVHNLPPYGPHTRLIRGMYSLFNVVQETFDVEDDLHNADFVYMFPLHCTLILQETLLRT